jgi:hypothetical protein
MKSDLLKVVFIHIPKCGGTSIENILFEHSERTPENFWMGAMNQRSSISRKLWSLGNRKSNNAPINRYQTGGLQHLTALQLRHSIGRQHFSSYYRFALVRHPVRRSLSQYQYMLRRPDLREWIGMKPNDSFLIYLKKTYIRAHVQWEPQINFVNDHLGNRLVHDIIRLEEIDDRMPGIFERIGIQSVSIPHLNRSPRSSSHRNLTSEERNLILELYKDDFQNFGYDIDTF